MAAAETFQLDRDMAEAYEQTFVPRLFARWASLLLDAARISPGQRLLDVATGTGIVAREALARGARVTAVDRNEAMLDVARAIEPAIAWHHGDALQLPFPDASFDVVSCQAGLMFFDPARALAEMARVVVPDGAVVVQVWDRLQAQPAYVTLAEVAARHAGPDVVDLLGAYFVRGDLDELISLLEGAGLSAGKAHTRETEMRFGSLEEFVGTEIAATPLAERLSDEEQRRVIEDAVAALGSYRTADGAASVPIRGHIIAASKRAP